jgi:type IV pilus assembly protein PilC
MYTFNCSYIDSYGKKVKKVIVSTSSEAVHKIIENNSGIVIEIKEQSKNVESFIIKTTKSIFTRKLNSRELIFILSSVAEIDAIGGSVEDALDMISSDRSISQKSRNFTIMVKKLVSSGFKLSEAIEKTQLVSKLYVGIISVAEKIGRYDLILRKTIEYIKWSDELKVKLRKSLSNPIITLAVTFSSIFFAASFSIPKVIDFLQSINIKIPQQTIYLAKFSDFISKNILFIIIAIFISYVLYKLLLKFGNESIILIIDKSKMRMPIFGELFKKIEASRFTSLFGIMYKYGMEIEKIMNQCSIASSNFYVRKSFQKIRQQIIGGNSLDGSVRNFDIFPKNLYTIIRIGEKSGKFNDVLDNIRIFYDRDIDFKLDKTLGFLKGFTIIISGAIILWVFSATLGPIYSNLGSIGQDQGTSVDYNL